MIGVTNEMVEAFDRAMTNVCLEESETRTGLATVLAIVEREQSDLNGLMRGAAAARRIADRYGDKGKDRGRHDWRTWTAMSAGARAVAVRLTELADAEERTDSAPDQGRTDTASNPGGAS